MDGTTVRALPPRLEGRGFSHIYMTGFGNLGASAFEGVAVEEKEMPAENQTTTSRTQDVASESIQPHQNIPPNHYNPKGEFEVNLVDENIQHAIGRGSSCKNGEFEFNSGVLIEGSLLEGSLKVNGTLIMKPGSKVTGSIDCDRLILMGEVDCETVIVRGLLVAWSGKLKAKNGIYCDSLEASSSCKLFGSLKDISELTDKAGL